MRKHKVMQINIKIYQEDENNENLRDFMTKIIKTTNDNTLAVGSIFLEEKELFSLKNGFKI